MKFLVLLAAVVACVSGASINAGWVLPAGNIGTSGILRKDGSTDLFSHEFAHRIVAIGPSGIILEDGSPVQLDADLNMVGRSKRSAGYVSKAGSIGFSGIVRTDGTIDQFGHDMAHNILVMGPPASSEERPTTSSWTRT
ncbi:cuticle protein CP1158-like [Penaeus japonicus]|uniref:cuticle protein CP1158-like n=1 Tax=Penaeus japonicus TaxID=27405 RepID=UPI001C716449|nr:cuticle protein CP1158-like [Penaeus japonicus]